MEKIHHTYLEMENGSGEELENGTASDVGQHQKDWNKINFYRTRRFLKRQDSRKMT